MFCVRNTAPTPGRRPKSTEARFSPTVTGRSCMAIPCSPQGRSCGSPTMRRPSDGTTRLNIRSEEHTSELQSHLNIVCRLLLEKKNHGTTNLNIRSEAHTSESQLQSHLVSR